MDFFSSSFSNQIKFELSESDATNESKVSTAQKTKKHRADKKDLGFEPDKILGATEYDGKIEFRIKVKDNEEWKIVKAKNAHAACPKLVIDFYEKHLHLNGEPISRNK